MPPALAGSTWSVQCLSCPQYRSALSPSALKCRITGREAQEAAELFGKPPPRKQVEDADFTRDTALILTPNRKRRCAMPIRYSKEASKEIESSYGSPAKYPAWETSVNESKVEPVSHLKAAQVSGQGSPIQNDLCTNMSENPS